MARRENQAEQVVADVVIERGNVVGHGIFLLRLEFAAQLAVLAIKQRAAAHQIDRAVFRRGHQPGTGIRRDALARPLFERGNQSVVRQIFGGR